MISRPNCSLHSLPITQICLQQACINTRIACQYCKQIKHRNHNLIAINNLDQITSNNILGNANDSQISDQYMRSFIQKFNKYQNQWQSFNKLIIDTKIAQKQKTIPAYFYLNNILKGKINQQIYNLVSKNQGNGKQIEQIAKIICYLQKTSNKQKPNISKLLRNANLRLEKSLNDLKNRIQTALYDFNIQMTYLTANNWEYLQKNDYVPQKNMSSNVKNNSEHKNMQHNKSNINISNKRQNLSINEKVQRQITKIFNEVFIQQSTQKQQQIQSNKQYKIKSPILVPQAFKRKIIQPPIKAMIQKQNQQYISNKYIRFVIKSHKQTQKIPKNIILQTIQDLSKDIKYSKQLRQFIIQGCNEFDIQCLQQLANKFPKLQKFNYVWDFEQQGLRLQKQQIFYQAKHAFSQNDEDLQISKLNQKLLDIYQKFENLKNLAITNMQKLIYQDITIKNKKIKHITLGQYVQSWQYIQIPMSVKKQVLTFKQLITLNLFNIMKIDGDFFDKIFTANVNSLKTIWLSQCIEIQESVLRIIGQSKLQCMIFEQIKRIDFPFFIPSTIKTVAIQNCQIFTKVPFVGLNKATNLQNFSIFQCVFYNAQKIGDKIIQQLSLINPCNIQYLNVGEYNLSKMRKLKDLCIDNTRIDLLSISRTQIILRNIQRLAIVGIQLFDQLKIQNGKLTKQINYRVRIEKILKRSPKLKTICLNYENQLCKINRQVFENAKSLRNIALILKKSQGRGKNNYKGLQKLKQMLEQLNKNVQIV